MFVEWVGVSGHFLLLLSRSCAGNRLCWTRGNPNPPTPLALVHVLPEYFLEKELGLGES
jgi:hypothetical protein